MAPFKVVIVGAGGETGSSIVNGLLSSTETQFEITALARPTSVTKPENVALKERGVNVIPADLRGPKDELVKLLTGTEAVISCVDLNGFADQNNLAEAAKEAGVKRFVPCSFATVAPPKGVMLLRDQKEDVLNHVKKIYLPFTVIDVGWWYQISVPKVPSGRTDYILSTPTNTVPGDGNVPSARTDLRDIGRYVAKIITDPRTLNKSVFVYNELLSTNQVYDIVDKLSGEKAERAYLPADHILAGIDEAQKSLGSNSGDTMALFKLMMLQYLHSWGIRGDNTPEYANYLGYLNGKELYPELEFTKFEDYVKEVLDGKGGKVYANKKW